MRRRDFITFFATTAAMSCVGMSATRAQQPREQMRRVGMLVGLAESDPEARSFPLKRESRVAC